MAGLNIKVIKSTKNVLLNRRELEISIKHEDKSTPNKKELTSMISSNYSTPASQIYVFNIKTGYGVQESVATAHVYNSIESLKAVERDAVIARMTGEVKNKIKRITKKQEKNKNRKVFGSERRNRLKAEKRAKN